MAQTPLQPSGQRHDLNLKHRLGLLVLVFLLLVTVMTFTTRATLVQRESLDADIENRYEPARTHLNSLVVQLLAREPSDEAMAADLARLNAVVGDHPDLESAIRAVERELGAWEEQGGDPDAVLGQVNATRGELREVQRQAAADLQAAEMRLGLLLWTVLGLAVGLVLLAAWLVRRWVTVPLSRIASAADRVREGDLHHPIPEVGCGELSALARDLERMRARIVGLFDASQRATEALDQQGDAVVGLRSELEASSTELPDEVEFAGVVEPAEGVLAGDWFDCVQLRDGRLALAVVDVSGHGPEAGILALRAKHLLRPALDDGRAPGEALTWLASHLGDTGERFLSLFLAEVDTRTGRCRWASAGHPPGAIVGDGPARELEPTGPVMGPFPGRWWTDEAYLPAGAVLVAYTDGLVEARSNGEQFGYERLFEVLERSAGERPQTLVETSLDEVRRFARRRPDDDLTVAALSLTESRAPSVWVKPSGGAPLSSLPSTSTG